MIEREDGVLEVAEMQQKAETGEAVGEALGKMLDLEPEEFERAMRRIAEAEDETFRAQQTGEEPTPIPGWPTFSKDELLDIKGVWFKVMGQRGGMMYLRPMGPTSALVKRLARRQEKGA